MYLYLYAVCSTSGDPPCVYGYCVRGQCACLPLVEGDTCEIGAVSTCSTPEYTYYVLCLVSSCVECSNCLYSYANAHIMLNQALFLSIHWDICSLELVAYNSLSCLQHIYICTVISTVYFFCLLTIILCTAPANASQCGDYFCLFGGTCNTANNTCQCVPPFYGNYCANSTGEDRPTQCTGLYISISSMQLM